MATPLFGSPDESNRYANTEAIDGIGFVALAKTYGQENLAAAAELSTVMAHRRERAVACE